MARLPSGGGSGSSEDTDDEPMRNRRTRPTGVAGPDETPDAGDDGEDIPRRRGGTDGGRSGRDGSPDGDSGTDIPQRRGGTGGGRAGRDDTDQRRRGDRPTGRTRPDQTPGQRDGDRVADDMGRAADDAGRDIPTRRGGLRAGRGRITQTQLDAVDREQRAIDRAATAVSRDPGRGRRDPVAEVEAVEAALRDASATTRRTGPDEYGADVEGFDEVGSGAFDLPQGFGGGVQDTAQREFDDLIGGASDDTAAFAEDVRRDTVDFLVDRGPEAAATAAAVGVAAPEPVTTGAGAAVLGGLAVGGVAFDVARREGLITPEEGGFLDQPEVTPGEGVQPTRVLVPEEGQTVTSELPAVDRDVNEIPVPERPPGTTQGEIGVPVLGASRLAQQQRQRQREERQRRERERSPFGGASEEELDEILRGPDEEVTIGEETPPSERVEDDVGREFERERDTDPRVVQPDETTDDIAEESIDRANEAQQMFVSEVAAQRPTQVTSPGIDAMTASAADIATRRDVAQSQRQGTQTDLTTDLDVPTDDLTRPLEAPATPAEPGFPSLNPNEFVDERGFGTPQGALDDFLTRPRDLDLFEQETADDMETMAASLSNGEFESPIRAPEEGFAALFGLGDRR